MIAFKFLRPGRRGRFSDARWPAPGKGAADDWIETSDPLETCVSGIHACTPDQLAYWLDDELWRVELDGELHLEPTLVIASRGRLVDPVGAWPGAAAPFAVECALRTAELASSRPDEPRLAELAGDAAWHAERAADTRQAVLAAYTSAVAADVLQPGGFDEERARQGRALARLLSLS